MSRCVTRVCSPLAPAPTCAPFCTQLSALRDPRSCVCWPPLWDHPSPLSDPRRCLRRPPPPPLVQGQPPGAPNPARKTCTTLPPPAAAGAGATSWRSGSLNPKPYTPNFDNLAAACRRCCRGNLPAPGLPASGASAAGGGSGAGPGGGGAAVALAAALGSPPHPQVDVGEAVDRALRRWV